MTLGTSRLYSASIEDASEEMVRRASRVCPFSDEAKNEDELGAPHAHGSELSHDTRVGSLTRVFAGRLTDDERLLGSSSGGLTGWLLEQLLTRGLVDAVVHVGRSPGDELFGYRISTSAEQIRGDRKSQYYATTLATVLEEVRSSSLRYALVGVPCFIKAARLLADQDPMIDERLTFYIGLVCGHLKSQFFAESLAWQVGVEPDDLGGVDFRVKNPDAPASRYDFAAWSLGHSVQGSQRTSTLIGGNWGHGAFQPEACNFCDDIFAETADIALGDAWLPEYTANWRGTNVVVSRNPLLDALFDEGEDADEVIVHPLDVDAAARSQAGNFRHRRMGLSVRLADDAAAGLSVPVKRVPPDPNAADPRRRRLIRHRRAMSRLSFSSYLDARRQRNLSIYTDAMTNAARRYNRIERPVWRRAAASIKRLLGR